jgi:lipopolysaccharide transport system ATP-binding protein
LLAELISQAAGVVGHSYHLAITALASGVPAFTPVDLSVGKYAALQGFETIYPLAKDKELDPDWFIKRLGKTMPSPSVLTARKQLTQHWDRVAAVLVAGATATQPAVNQFWQSLPFLLEDAAIRVNPAAEASEMKSVEKRGRSDEVYLRLARSRAEVTARDDRIAALYNSTSWKVTGPLRLLMHKLKRLAGNGSGR